MVIRVTRRALDARPYKKDGQEFDTWISVSIALGQLDARSRDEVKHERKMYNRVRDDKLHHGYQPTLEQSHDQKQWIKNS